MKFTLFLFITLTLFQPSLYSQRNKKNDKHNKDSLFADFDLFNLKGINNIPPGNPDSLKHLVKYTCSASGQPVSLEVISYEERKPAWRKAMIRHTSLGTLIDFQKLKNPGGSGGILGGGEVLVFRDSILVSHDTIFFKSLHEEGFDLQIILPVKNDTLRIIDIHKGSRRFEELNGFEPWINLAHYKEWFNKPGNTYTLLKDKEHYEIIQVNTTDPLSDRDYKYLQSQYRRMGTSPFWIAIRNNLTWKW